MARAKLLLAHPCKLKSPFSDSHLLSTQVMYALNTFSRKLSLCLKRNGIIDQQPISIPTTSSAPWDKIWLFSTFKTIFVLTCMRPTPALPLKMPTLTNLTNARPSYATCMKLLATLGAEINSSFRLTSFCTMFFVSLKLRPTACWSSSPLKRRKKPASRTHSTSAKPWPWETTADSSNCTEKPLTWLGLSLTFLLTNFVFYVYRSWLWPSSFPGSKLSTSSAT